MLGQVVGEQPHRIELWAGTVSSEFAFKVDRAFVRDIGSGGRGEIIAQLIVQLGKMLGLQIIGEGIESEIQAAVLRSWGCHEGQGFLYSQAVDPIALADWINRHGRNSPLPRRGGAAGGQKPV